MLFLLKPVLSAIIKKRIHPHVCSLKLYLNHGARLCSCLGDSTTQILLHAACWQAYHVGGVGLELHVPPNICKSGKPGCIGQAGRCFAGTKALNCRCGNSHLAVIKTSWQLFHILVWAKCFATIWGRHHPTPNRSQIVG